MWPPLGDGKAGPIRGVHSSENGRVAGPGRIRGADTGGGYGGRIRGAHTGGAFRGTPKLYREGKYVNAPRFISYPDPPPNFLNAGSAPAGQFPFQFLTILGIHFLDIIIGEFWEDGCVG